MDPNSRSPRAHDTYDNGHASFLPTDLDERIGQVRDRMDDVDRQVRRVVLERPLVAVGIAVFTGFVLGRLLGKR